MRILVVGAGSTGGYFGGRLAQAGRDVTFLVRPERAALLRADGLQILSPHGDVTLVPRLVTAAHLDGPFDAVLLTVKAYSLDAAMEDIAPAVGRETMILPVLNGMGHVGKLAGASASGRSSAASARSRPASTTGAASCSSPRSRSWPTAR